MNFKRDGHVLLSSLSNYFFQVLKPRVINQQPYSLYYGKAVRTSGHKPDALLIST